jgi:hypothetical protein
MPVSPASIDDEGTVARLVRTPGGEVRLFVRGDTGRFDGTEVAGGRLGRLSVENAVALAERFDWLRPRRIPAGRTSFGFGDRLGLATPGHIRSLAGTMIFPVLAQQSVRENTRTGRTFADVLRDAVFGVFRAGYQGGFGADADHLKETSDAIEAAELGFSFFTCDPGDHVVATETMTPDEIHDRFDALPDADDLRSRYAERTFLVGDNLVLTMPTADLERAAVKYGAAVAHAAVMYAALRDHRPEGFDYEISVDETEIPTTPLEHLFVALELRRRRVEFVSLAPRFVGAMEKGVDWRGDAPRFESDLRLHAQIARAVGGYRLSLHSGSDKFSLYPSIARETRGLCHVKTAGTSYLVALEVIARCDPALFREIAALSLAAFAHDKATYHISADPARIPPIAELPDDALPGLVSAHDARQVLHVAFGSVLASPLAERLFARLATHEEDHFDALARHLGRHVHGLEVRQND